MRCATRCAWADDDTAAVLSFSPATVHVDMAAEEARRVREAMRTPVI